MIAIAGHCTFESTLKSTKASMDELTELFGGMNDSEGSLGMLMKDKEFYENMTSATRNLDLLLQDFRLNPKRYTTVLKKKSPAYTLPEDDPANARAHSRMISKVFMDVLLIECHLF